MSRRGVWLSLFLLALGGCAGRSQYRNFNHQVAADHPLVGRIWDSRQGKFVRRKVLLREAEKANYLLLGESHDNVDHHAIQASLLTAWLSVHQDSAVAFEQLDETQGQALARGSVQGPEDVRRLSRWDETGWPDFALYRQLIALALLPVEGPIAAHPDAPTLRAAMRELDYRAPDDLKLTPPLSPEAEQSLREEIIEAHCGHAPPDMVEGMITAQRLKDAWMARAMVQAHASRVALIAGSGHVRTDRGVPMYLARHGKRDIVSVAMLPVSPDSFDPRAYPVDAYDFVVFTTRTSPLSACERFKQQLSRIHVRRSPTVDDTLRAPAKMENKKPLDDLPAVPPSR